MCCDGTLYLYVALTDEDILRLKKHQQVKLTGKHEHPSFAVPCAFHDGKGCGVYADRPDACRRYFCGLLRAVERDELTDDEALLVIEEAHALVEIVKEYVAFEPGMPLAVSTWEDPPDEVQGEARVAWERALRFLRKHFLGPVPSPTHAAAPPRP